MKLLLLTGPAGAGKNTIAAAYAAQRSRCAVIDVDLVRWMVLQPHAAPWDGEEGHRQQLLGVQNASLLARSFLAAEFDVVIHDVVTNETARHYRQFLAGFDLHIVLLLPTLEEIQRRNRQRSPRITGAEIAMLYRWQTELTEYNQKLDNTTLAAEEVVRVLGRE